jgi:hypothetical protein
VGGPHDHPKYDRAGRRHRWDLAAATGQPFSADDATLDTARRFLAMFSGPGHDAGERVRAGGAGAVAEGAPQLEQVLAMAGRDVNWRA